MKLYIDTSNTDKITVGVNERYYSTEARAIKSQKLLPYILEILSAHGKELKDIKEIEVSPGPGSFTGLRVGMSVANTLAWILNVPINGQFVRRAGPLLPIY